MVLPGAAPGIVTGLAIGMGSSALVRIEPVGAHGVQLVFSDGHERGIYPWRLLQELAEMQARQAA